MEKIPVYLGLIFASTTALALFFFYRSTRKSRLVLIIAIVWLTIQSSLGLSGFYKTSGTIPPRFILLILPPLVTIVFLFITVPGIRFINGLNMKWLTLLHMLRIPVEIVLLLLFVNKSIPRVTTFEGRNMDILSGITAGLIYYFGFIKKNLDTRIMLVWNFICLGLLLNIVVIGILSAPSPIQQFAFDQPNIAIYYFPFVWLPSFIIPLVLLAHFAAIRQALKQNTKQKMIWRQSVTPL
ncbi:MAG TPA: hypothetical protein VMH01_07345 [Puia sp.]|nr:hypothetical protein [Puia sp.]